MIKLNTTLQHVSKIVHAGDIHIRNLKRHTEYRIQFQKFYDSIAELKDDNTIILIAGDIVHTKTDMSPELIAMVSDFFVSLASLAPTIVITGNHDANLNNPDRLDALSPIVDNLQHPNLFYLKDTGLYEFGDVIFSVMSVFDDKSKYILADQIDSTKKKIALYHGPVTNSVTAAGHDIQGHVTVDIFDGYDCALLGDIHQLQYLNMNHTIAYCSSLIQQNFGETYENHGFLLWDLNSTLPKSEFYHLDNDYGYHTLHIHNNVLVPYNRDLITLKSRVRVKATDSTESNIRDEVVNIKRDLGITELSVNIAASMVLNPEIDLTKSATVNVRDIDTQNALIRDYLNLTLNLDLSGGILDRIYDINAKTNAQLVETDEVIRNVIWKPREFKFSNMFSYGEDNVIDFSDLSGIQGLFGPNASGKSSILDALCFCLFDTTSRAYKADQILNTQKDWFSCEFYFDIEGVSYHIKKYGKKSPSGKVKVNIEFWSEDENGTITNLNGEQRRDTNSIIKSYIGTYDDFTLTCLSIQNNGTNFVDKSQTERKEILAKFLDLNVFDSLYGIANTEYKRISTLIADVDIASLANSIQLLTDEIAKQKNEFDLLQTSINDTQKIIDDCNAQIVELSKQLMPTKDIDLAKCEHNKQLYVASIESAETRIRAAKRELVKYEREFDALTSQLEAFNIVELNAREREFEASKSKLRALNSKIDKLNIQIAHKEDKLAKLAEHEYDPNCKYCMNNVFVVDAIQTRDQLNIDVSELKSVMQERDSIESQLQGFNDVVTLRKKYQELSQRHVELKSFIQSQSIRILSDEKEIAVYNLELVQIERDIQTYHDNERVIHNNSLIDAKIVQLKFESLTPNIAMLKSLKDSQLSLHGLINVNETKLTEATTKLGTTNNLMREKVAYEYYLMAMEKDGISYQLMSKTLPKVETEINNILSNLVEFKLLLNTDGKNINAYIVYNDLYWPLELSSGMERFISAIAIRVALVNISSLPKPTFFVIDEGLGVLDSTNLNQIYLMFNYIREIFQFSLIISHIDMVRDMVDNTIMIERNEGFSKLVLN